MPMTKNQEKRSGTKKGRSKRNLWRHQSLEKLRRSSPSVKGMITVNKFPSPWNRWILLKIIMGRGPRGGGQIHFALRIFHFAFLNYKKSKIVQTKIAQSFYPPPPLPMNQIYNNIHYKREGEIHILIPFCYRRGTPPEFFQWLMSSRITLIASFFSYTSFSLAPHYMAINP